MDGSRTPASSEETVVAVLAGGRGARIGGAKATVELAGRPLISYPLTAAREASLPVVVVAREEADLPPLSAPVLRDPGGSHHPLRGVVTALCGARRVLAVGCDMPFLTADLLAWIAAQPGELLVARVGGELQPLPALYGAAHLQALRDALARERSMRATLHALGARVLEEAALAPFGDPQRMLFSVNDSDDLDVARGWIG